MKISPNLSTQLIRVLVDEKFVDEQQIDDMSDAIYPLVRLADFR